MKAPNKSQSWADNVATMALAQEILILRTIVAAMIEVSQRREARLEHYKSMLRGVVAEVMRR